jgi:hypothetical protein
MSDVTHLTETALAYGCSFCTITMLWAMAARNHAAGWVRKRHPNCYEPVATPKADPVWEEMEARVGVQLTVLANALGEAGTGPVPEKQTQDQNLVWSATRSRSSK